MVALVTLAWASQALGAVRYAEPGGDGPAATCPQDDPCDIQVAVEGLVNVQDGDEVVVLPGDYALGTGDQISVSRVIDVHGQSGQPRPRLLSSAAFAVALNSPGISVRHLELEHSGSALGFFGTGYTLGDFIAHSSVSNAIPCTAVGDATIRDGVCWQSGAAGAAFSLGGPNSSFTMTLRNLTAIASGSGTFTNGIEASAGGNANITIDAKGVIAQGGPTDIRSFVQSTTSVVIDLDHSNYDTTDFGAQPGGTASVTDPTTNSNQTAAPVFSNAAVGDFHQQATSPTIDAGDVDASGGSTDFDGDPRSLDGNDDCTATADIGADEFVDPTPSDCTPPGTTISGDPPVLTNDRTPSFDFSSTESNSTFECSIDQGTPSFAPCSNPGPGTTGSNTPASGLDDGAYTFRVRATDANSNTDTSPDTHGFTVDATPPTATITGSPPGLTNDPTPTLDFSSSESSSTFECSIDQGTQSFAPCSSPGPGTTGSHTPGSGLADGAYTFRVRSKDAANNTGGADTHGLTVDTAAPQTTLGSGPPQGSTTSDRTPTFGFSSSEGGSSFECRVDGGSFTGCMRPRTTAPLSNGQHTFQVRATDQATNTDPTPASRTFAVDTSKPPPATDDDPPETMITAAPKAKTKSRNADFEFSSDEPGSSFECLLDGEELGACTSPFTRKVKRKRHTLGVIATDEAGNVDPTPAEHSWKVKKRRRK